MAKTRTSGITVDADGCRIVSKQVAGATIFRRLGKTTQEAAEQWLATATERERLERTRGSRPRVTFREASVRYLRDNMHLASIHDAAWHVEMLDEWIGDLPLEDVCDETLEPFRKQRLKVDGVSLTTYNRSVEIVRRILNLAARRWRHPNRMTWLETAPLLTLRRNHQAREPYPLTWEEQRYLFGELPADPNGHMALFKVNTGTREQEVCGLQWSWEVAVEELNTSVFIIPGNRVKNREDRLVVLNDVAKSVIEARRALAAVEFEKTRTWPRWVFTYRGRRLNFMNNSAWQNARANAAEKWLQDKSVEPQAAFARVRIHDLKHTFGRRLRSAGVGEETRKVLLGHKNGDITTHYSAAELAELIVAVNRIDASRETPAITVLRRAVDSDESCESLARRKRASSRRP